MKNFSVLVSFASIFVLTTACTDEFGETDGNDGMGGGGMTTTTTTSSVAPGDRDRDRDTFSRNDGDCDDYNPDVNPGESERNNGFDDNCNGLVDEGFGGTGGSNNTGTTTGTGTGTGTSNPIDNDTTKMFPHWDRDADTDAMVYTTIWFDDDGESAESTCAMNLWGVEGVDEVFTCVFVVPAGVEIEATAWTYKLPEMTTQWIFDMCGYTGGAGNCGTVNYCEDNSGGVKASDGHDHILGRDYWWTANAIDGVFVPNDWTNNPDNLPECTSNQVVTAPASL